MENAIFIAKVGGILYLAIGLGMLFNPGQMQKIMDGFTKNAGLTYLTGLMIAVLGMAIILSYNVWEWNLAVIVTIIGWIGFLKGLSLIIMPKTFIKMGARMVKKLGIVVIPFAFLLGLALTYLGFFA